MSDFSLDDKEITDRFSHLMEFHPQSVLHCSGFCHCIGFQSWRVPRSVCANHRAVMSVMNCEFVSGSLR